MTAEVTWEKLEEEDPSGLTLHQRPVRKTTADLPTARHLFIPQALQQPPELYREAERQLRENEEMWCCLQC